MRRPRGLHIELRHHGHGSRVVVLGRGLGLLLRYMGLRLRYLCLELIEGLNPVSFLRRVDMDESPSIEVDDLNRTRGVLSS